ncbi:MAG TPA: hypothetical protein VGQ83_03205 [Polyangia bacterium]|jgi:hypothetical protein
MRTPILGLILTVALAAGGPAGAAPPAKAGFRAYGDPMFETVFPDTEGFRKWVDQLVVVHERMEVLRTDFARAVQRVLVEVTRPVGVKEKLAKRCVKVAEPFARAQRLGQDYLNQGRDLVRVYDLLTKLDELGETAGLTSDYRAKVHRVREVYRGLKSDYREMKYTFHEQLIPEVRHAGCDPDALVAAAVKGVKEAAKAEAAEAAASAPAPTTIPPQAMPKRATADTPPRPATMITFNVDNAHCQSAVTVTVDGTVAGEVQAQSRGGFRTRSGPHELCLLHATSPGKCGQPGTIRKTYLHDGWTIQLRCPNQK